MTARPIVAPWDEERLNAAFAARAGRVPSTPPDLAIAVRARLASESRRPALGFRRLAPGLGLAAVVVVAIALGAGQLERPRPGAPSSPGAVDSATLLGQPMSVREAIAVRDGGVDDREIAVTGFLARYGFLGCPFDSTPRNPTRLGCPAFATWLLDAPEVLVTTSGGTTSGHPPTGPSIQPSFDVSSFPDVGPSASRLTLFGHFDDRRAALCKPADRDACGSTFVVDRIAAIDGVEQRVGTTADGAVPPRSAIEDVDRVLSGAVPGATILSRHLVGGDTAPIGDVEPGLRVDPAWTSERAVWIVTTVQAAAEHSIVRTFLVTDGTNNVFEMTATGPIRLTSQKPAAESSSSTVAFPTTWLRMPVLDVADLDLGPGTTLKDDRTMAVRGFFVPADPSAVCPSMPPAPSSVADPAEPVSDPGPIAQPCAAGRPWFLSSPEHLATSAGPPWIDHGPAGPAINPILPPDVAFTSPAGWFAAGPTPLPVIVLGHVADHRATTDVDYRNFVIDAFVWQAGEEVPAAATFPNAVDAPAAVIARVERALGPSVATWLTLRPGAGIAEWEPGCCVPELAGAERVWVVRRLVAGLTSMHIATAYTPDDGGRVWDGPVLATTLDVDLSGDVTLKVLDPQGVVTGVRREATTDAGSWVMRPGPEGTGDISIRVDPARPNDLWIRWIGGACDRVWRLDWLSRDEFLLTPEFQASSCRLNGIQREIVVTLDHRVDLAGIGVSSGGAGG